MRRARSSMDAPALPTHTGGANRTLSSRPTPAPMRVSSTRSHACTVNWLTPSTSIALMATSLTNSSTRTNCPMTSAARMISPRLHHVSPTSTLNPTAISTPTTTEFTRRMPVVSVE